MISAGFMVVSLISCGSQTHLIVYQTETEWVDLREWPSGYPAISHLPHPAKVQSPQIRSLLTNIRHRQSAMFSFHMGNPQATFSDHQVNMLASQLPKAFAQALPEEVIGFRVRVTPQSHHYTAGWCFLYNGEFHLIIHELVQPEFSSPANQSGPSPIRWEFARQAGQRIFVPSIGSTHEFPHWLVISLS